MKIRSLKKSQSVTLFFLNPGGRKLELTVKNLQIKRVAVKGLIHWRQCQDSYQIPGGEDFTCRNFFT